MKRIDPRRLICLGITAATVASLGCICSADETDEIPTEPEETVCSEEDTEIMEEAIIEETEDPDDMIPEEETFIEEEIIIEEESEETIDLLEDAGTMEVLAASGWMEECGDWYYYENGEPVTGWKKIGGHWYFFNSLGVMYTGMMLEGSDVFFSMKTAT